MAQNSISPGFVKIYYTVETRPHVMTIPVIPIDPDPLVVGNELQQKNGFAAVFGTAMTDLVTAIKAFYSTSSEFQYAELWSKPLPTDDPIFVEVFPLAILGIAGSAAVKSSQTVLTHRTIYGGIHRLYLMETVQQPNLRDVAPFAPGGAQNLSLAISNAFSVVVGRDGGVLTAPKAYTTKTNDVLRKKQLSL